jgi:hypothetical protein
VCSTGRTESPTFWIRLWEKSSSSSWPHLYKWGGKLRIWFVPERAVHGVRRRCQGPLGPEP